MTAELAKRKDIYEILSDFGKGGLEPLKELFWSRLNYDRVNQPLSRKGWNDTAKNALAEDPVLWASGGAGDAFHVIYARLASPDLKRMLERPVVNALLREHPYALFAFSNDAQTQWHLLNVKYDERIEKRQVFRRIALGPFERTRTAAERISLLDLDDLRPDMLGVSPLTIQQSHDDAFDVEKVQKDFFRTLKAIYDESIVPDIQKGVKDKEQASQAGLILLNRLIFLYFIQKKGWLDGKPDYLWHAFKEHRAKPKARTYYADFLCRLFEALSIPKLDRMYDHMIGFRKIPFLNGGLFEPNALVSAADLHVTNATCASLFDELLEHYNFTVMEDTPLDVEVAVDPEMLGKIFEELVTSRHESGAYYTPRPIVSFMCKEALKNYLVGQAFQPASSQPASGKATSAQAGKPSPLEAIERFVEQHDASELKDPEAVLEKLRTIKVCDPACGSGAYLVGMLQELMALRRALFTEHEVDSHTDYERKLDIIQNSLYGVDMDLTAVNIARLRLWLTLCVDYEVSGRGDPPPLPNLDFKIECEDSILGPAPGQVQTDLLTKGLIADFEKKKAQYSRDNVYTHKAGLRSEIDALRRSISQAVHPGRQAGGFDWAVEFAEVFSRGTGGFDVVLANPPYVRQELIKGIKPALKERYPETYTGTADLYCYFYVRALQVLRPGGTLAFISPNKWFRAAYGEKLRHYLSGNACVLGITDFGELPVFENAATFPMIFVASKVDTSRSTERVEISHRTVFTEVKSLEPPYPDVRRLVLDHGQTLPVDAIQKSDWTLASAHTSSILKKMETVGVPLGKYVDERIFYGVKTGLNEAWVDSNGNIYTKGEKRPPDAVKHGVFVIDGAKRAELVRQDSKSAEIIKPLAVGDDIRKWRIDQKDRWLIVTRIGTDMKRYPAVMAHLKRYRSALEKRQDQGEHWWELRACAYYDAFGKPKIVFPDIAMEPRFVLDLKRSYVTNTTYFIPTDDLYLCGVLNSTPVWDYCAERFTINGDANDGGRLRFFRQFVVKIPIPTPSSQERKCIEALVRKCIGAEGDGCREWEEEIDDRVAGLYGLSPSERRTSASR